MWRLYPTSGVRYIKCTDEKSLLLEFINDWSKNYPDIITGWNIRFFDIPYLVNRIVNLLGERTAKRLSPWGWYKESSITGIGGRRHQVYELVGVSALDYMDAYKKFTYVNQESYSLNHIAYVELEERKLDYSEVDTLHELYRTDFQKFIDYNVKDVVLVERIENKLKVPITIISVGPDRKQTIFRKNY